MKTYVLNILIILTAILFITFQPYAESHVSYNKELDGFQYPFNVKTFHFNSQNQALKMRYMDIGDEKAKKVIVLLHGKNFAGYYWKDTIKHLKQQNYRVIVPDQIGFGKSSKPLHYQYNFAQLALNTKQLLDSLGVEQYDIVGHSMGGMLAVTYSVNYSEYVNKLILINPIGLEDYSQYVQYKDTNFFYQLQLKASFKKAINYQKKNYYDGKWSTQYEQLLQPLKGMIAGDDWKIIAWNNALTYGPIFSESIVAKFPHITNKTFLIIGTRDTTGPGRNWLKPNVNRKLGNYKVLGKQAHKKIPNSTLIELDGLGHMPMYENYEVFIQAFNQALDHE